MGQERGQGMAIRKGDGGVPHWARPYSSSYTSSASGCAARRQGVAWLHAAGVLSKTDRPPTSGVEATYAKRGEDAGRCDAMRYDARRCEARRGEVRYRRSLYRGETAGVR
jgi:hypothetical protein